jgi:cytochrome o ubiquinol oxidase subunit 3
LVLFFATFLLGASFLIMELTEFSEFVEAGHTWQTSAFLSAFFTLVGTHGLHITFGLLWIAVMLFLVWKRGLIASTHRRLACLSLFWHFLDVIWIFIFTFVYLLGVQ